MRRATLLAFLTAGALLCLAMWLVRSAPRFHGSAIVAGLAVGRIMGEVTW